MTRVRTAIFLAAALGAGALAGCGADVPQSPTWREDVYPILVARCTRCHNANATRDPESMPDRAVLGNFDHASYDDFAAGDKSFFHLAPTQVSTGMMPIPPAAKLEDWQIQTITRFVNNNPLATQ